MSNDPSRLAAYARQLADMQQRLGSFHERHRGEPETFPAEAIEAVEALDVTVEELRVALDELQKKNHELQHLQLAAEASRKRYQELFDSAPDGYLVTNLNGTIREANQVAAVMLGRQLRF